MVSRESSRSYSLDMLIAFVLVYNIFSSNKLNLPSFVFCKLALIFEKTAGVSVFMLLSLILSLRFHILYC